MKTLITKLKLYLFLHLGRSLRFDIIEFDDDNGVVTSVTFTKTNKDKNQ